MIYARGSQTVVYTAVWAWGLTPGQATPYWKGPKWQNIVWALSKFLFLFFWVFNTNYYIGAFYVLNVYIIY